MCSNGLDGVETSGVCCVAECGTCGGSGCGSRAQAAGLTAADCCVGRITDENVYCDDSEVAPCIIGSGAGFGQIWLTMAYFIARDVLKLPIDRSKTWNESGFMQLYHRVFGAVHPHVTCMQ